MAIKTYKNELSLVLITACVVSLMILFNDINREIRIKELKVFLQTSERADNNLDHIGLVMKYRLSKRLYENRISEDNADMIELKVNSLLGEMTQKKRVPLRDYEFLSVPAMHTINFFRFILGKNPIRDYDDVKSNIYLEIAYYYERNKYYNKALEIYDKALKDRLDRPTAAGILLHRGFCQSILGNFKEARGDYTAVIKDYSDEKTAITAAILLRYLEGFRSEAVKVIREEKDSVVKGEKLYRLIAYRESLDVLDKVEKEAPPEEKSRIRFAKAKCFEEIAEKENAVNTYQKIIKEDTRSDYAKMANRRVFIIGSLANNGEGLKEKAVANNEVLKDDSFTRMVDEVSKIEKTERPVQAGTVSDMLENTMKSFEEQSPVINEKKIESFEGLSREDNPEKAKEKSRKKEKLKKVKIYTTDGNIFVGSILQETGEAVFLRTMIGKVSIKKNQILKRENK